MNLAETQVKMDIWMEKYVSSGTQTWVFEVLKKKIAQHYLSFFSSNTGD